MNGKLDKGKENIYQYMFAGKACFTLVNSKTATRLTLVFKANKDRDTFFVYVRKGEEDFFAGTIFEKSKFYQGRKSKFTESSTEIKTIKWLVANLPKLEEYPTLDVYHDGKCAKCGKQLTVPESIVIGMGAECYKRTRKEMATLFPKATTPI